MIKPAYKALEHCYPKESTDITEQEIDKAFDGLTHRVNPKDINFAMCGQPRNGKKIYRGKPKTSECPLCFSFTLEEWMQGL